MEKSIGCRMPELEPIKGYDCKKTAMSQCKSGNFAKNNLQIPTPPKAFQFF